MKTSVADLILPAEATHDDVRRRLNETCEGVALICDTRARFVRTVTDGDLRRAVLDGHRGDSAVGTLKGPSAPAFVGQRASLAQIMALMDERSIDHVPVLDEAHRVVDLVSRREITSKVWLSSPHLGEEEAAFVDEAFKTNWIAPLGPNVDAFEREVAGHIGVGHAAALTSGTAAIHLGLILLGVKAGDTVFCSSLTFAGSSNPILYCGAKPVFIDSEPSTWNMSPLALERAFEWAQANGRMPKCVIVVNLYGQSADMDALLPICDRYGVPVLEDAAESLGAHYKGQHSGRFGRVSVFSFNGNKIITTSGGGMLLSEDGDLIVHARKLSTQARDAAAHYEHTELGFNYRMSNVLAGIGRGQMRVLEDRVARRRAVFDAYRERFAQSDLIRWMPEPQGYRSTRWLSCLVLNAANGAQAKDEIIQALERHAVEARPIWKPMHLQPLYRGCEYFEHRPGQDVAQHLFANGLCLPSGSNMTSMQTDRVLAALQTAFAAIAPADRMESALAE